MSGAPGLALLVLTACAPAIASHHVREDPEVRGDPELHATAVRQFQRVAGLLGYERVLIVLRFDTLPGDVIARLLPHPASRAVVIPLDVRYFTRHPKQLCEIAAHELLHGKLLPLRQALLSFIHPADTMTIRQAVTLEEGVVTDLARLRVWGCP